MVDTGNILYWLFNGRVGASSKAMAAKALGVRIENASDRESYPRDPDDFYRCLQLLYAAPEVREAFDEIARLSPKWAALIARWDDVEALFVEEVGPHWLRRDVSAHLTYDLMKSIYQAARD